MEKFGIFDLLDALSVLAPTPSSPSASDPAFSSPDPSAFLGEKFGKTSPSSPAPTDGEGLGVFFSPSGSEPSEERPRPFSPPIQTSFSSSTVDERTERTPMQGNAFLELVSRHEEIAKRIGKKK